MTVMNRVDVEIRPLTTLAELAEVEPLMRDIWGMNDLEIISMHTLHAMVHSGGQILGAFDGNRLIGFVVSILGSQSNPQLPAAAQLKVYSVIAGVADAYQNKNVGYLLKLAQRAFVISIGIPQVVWTYDPLESRNARFNIFKLGAVCHKYHRHFHGDMSGINAGLPTDRFEVDWWVTDERVQKKIEGGGRPLTLTQLPPDDYVIINPSTPNAAGLLMPPDVRQPAAVWRQAESNRLLVEIPPNFQYLKRQDFALANRWRHHTRLIFEELFSCGYAVTDFIFEEIDKVRRSYYVLTKWEER